MNYAEMNKKQIKERIAQLENEILSLRVLLTSKTDDADAHQAMIQQVWSAYPGTRRNGKDAIFKKLAQMETSELEVILADIMTRKDVDTQWLGGYVPLISTYINQKRWNTDVDVIHPLKKMGVIGRNEDFVKGGYADRMIDGVDEALLSKAVESILKSGNRPYISAVDQEIQRMRRENNAEPIHVSAEQADSFLEFKALYPVKTWMNLAEKLWVEKNLGECHEIIINDIKNRLEHDVRWKDGYIPSSTNYLQERMWETGFKADVRMTNNSALESYIKDIENA